MSKKLESFGIDKSNFVIVNPNTSDFAPERRWIPERFVEVISLLVEKYNFTVIIPGTRGEYDYCNMIHQQLPQSVGNKFFNLAGKLSLEEFIALLGDAKFIISNDTGPMHMAWALRKPVIALFGQSLANKYGIFSHTIYLYHKIYCSPCAHEIDFPPCKGDNVCMQKITVSEVMQAVDKVVKNDYTEITMSSELLFNYDNGEALGRVQKVE